MKQTKSFSTGDIAKFCGVTLRTVIRWIERGDLNAYKLPGRGNNRVTAEELLHFLEEYKMPIPEELMGYQEEQNRLQKGGQHPKRILICDDESAYAKAIRRVLHKEGYDTRIAFSGFEAGTELMLFDPALITLDLSMPGMSGFEVVSFIRDHESIANVKILVVSALPEDDLEKAILLGADATLSKPFKNEEMLDIIKDLLE